MTWTYGNDPTNSSRDAVRYLVGDTDSNLAFVTDEEIAWALSQNSNNAYAAAAAVAAATVRAGAPPAPGAGLAGTVSGGRGWRTPWARRSGRPDR